MRRRHLCSRVRELDGEGAWLVAGEVSDQFALGNGRGTHFFFRSVDFACACDGHGEGDSNRSLRLARLLDHADDDFVALLGLLYGHDTDLRVVHAEQREALAERAIVFLAFEGDEGLIEANSLPVGVLLTPVAGVTSDAVVELVMTPVLRGLIAVERRPRD